MKNKILLLLFFLLGIVNVLLSFPMEIESQAKATAREHDLNRDRAIADDLATEDDSSSQQNITREEIANLSEKGPKDQIEEISLETALNSLKLEDFKNVLHQQTVTESDRLVIANESGVIKLEPVEESSNSNGKIKENRTINSALRYLIIQEHPLVNVDDILPEQSETSLSTKKLSDIFNALDEQEAVLKEKLKKLISRIPQVSDNDYKKADQAWDEKSKQPIQKAALKLEFNEAKHELNDIKQSHNEQDSITDTFNSLINFGANYLDRAGVFIPTVPSGYGVNLAVPSTEAAGIGKIVAGMVPDFNKQAREDAEKKVKEKKQELEKIRGEKLIELHDNIKENEEEAKNKEEKKTFNFADSLSQRPQEFFSQSEVVKAIGAIEANKIIQIGTKYPEVFKKQIQAAWKERISTFKEYIDPLKTEGLKRYKASKKTYSPFYEAREAAKKNLEKAKNFLIQALNDKTQARTEMEKAAFNYKREEKKLLELSEHDSAEGTDSNQEREEILNYISNNKLLKKWTEATEHFKETQKNYDAAEKRKEDCETIANQTKEKREEEFRLYKKQYDEILKIINRLEYCYNVDVKVGKEIFNINDFYELELTKLKL